MLYVSLEGSVQLLPNVSLVSLEDSVNVSS